MLLRLLCTLAILAGLAAAPGAQAFHWEAGRYDPAVERWTAHAEGLADRLARVFERVGDQLARRADRTAERLAPRAQRVERQAERVRERVETRLARRFDSVRADAGVVGALGLQALDAADPCAGQGQWDSDRFRFCEVREQRLPAGPLNVDAGRNGGIRVEAWDGADILVRAVVQARADSEDEARQIAGQVEVLAGGGRVSARGPSTRDSRWWSVSYRIQVPRRTDLDLTARNGGITIAGVDGTLRFDTTNGGVRLTDIAGDVVGRTRNGGVTVALAGERWDGAGLDVETSNGGVTLAIPERYSAQLETQTVNGRFRSDYPVTLTGELSPRRGVSATLGSGGAPVKVRTHNGGISVHRR